MQPLRKAEDWMRRLGDPEESVSEFELHRVLHALDQHRMGASREEAAVLRGLALGRLARHQEALVAFEEAIRLGFQTWEIYRNRAVAFMNTDDLESAARSLAEASERPEGYNILVLADLAGVFGGLGAFTEAREVLGEAIRLAADFQDYVYLARTAADVGEPDLVLELAARAAGQPEREDLEALAVELLQQDLPERLSSSLEFAVDLFQKAREREGEEDPPVEVSEEAVAEALRVFEAFTPLRLRANEWVMGQQSEGGGAQEA